MVLHIGCALFGDSSIFSELARRESLKNLVLYIRKNIVTKCYSSDSFSPISFILGQKHSEVDRHTGCALFDDSAILTN